MFAPIVVFAFNRPDSLRATIESLATNDLASQSDLIIYSDGPRHVQDLDNITAVRRYIMQLGEEFRRIIPHFATTNKGLGQSIIDGAGEVLRQYGKAIIIEDDLVCAKDFLSYMNQTLDFYENDPRIISVCGCGLKIKRPENYMGDVYLLGRSSSWGWGTWLNRWEQIDWQISDWESFSADKKAKKAFNRNGSDLYDLLKAYMSGKNNSWAIRFCYNQFRQNKYAVIPFISRIINRGFGDDATNCKQKYNRFKVEFRAEGCDGLQLPKHPPIDPQIERACRNYHTISIRMYSKLRKLLNL
ncbi:MAG: glycosyltransferase [Rikenellaceae bacterium]|nr:glycosyltransferase [Rikenellaceae bacterium]